MSNKKDIKVLDLKAAIGEDLLILLLKRMREQQIKSDTKKTKAKI